MAIIKRRVAECDAVVLGVGFGRGSVPKVSGLEASSFTKVEYDTASEIGLSVLVFQLKGSPKPPRVHLPDATSALIREENVWVERFKGGQLEARIVQMVSDVHEFEVAVAVAVTSFAEPSSNG